MFEADRHWDTLARLLIAWVAPPDKADEASALVERSGAVLRNAESADVARPGCASPPGDVPPGLAARSTGEPDLRYVSAILRAAGRRRDARGSRAADVTRIWPRAPTPAGSSPSAMVRIWWRSRSSDPGEQHAVPRTVHRHSCGEPVRALPQHARSGCCCSRFCRCPMRRGFGGWCSGSRPRRSPLRRVDFEELLPLAVRGWLARRGRSRRGGRARNGAPATDADQRRRCDPMRGGPTRGRTISAARQRSPRSCGRAQSAKRCQPICCASRASCRRDSRDSARLPR